MKCLTYPALVLPASPRVPSSPFLSPTVCRPSSCQLVSSVRPARSPFSVFPEQRPSCVPQRPSSHCAVWSANTPITSSFCVALEHLSATALPSWAPLGSPTNSFHSPHPTPPPAPCPLAKQAAVPTSRHLGCRPSHGASSLHTSPIWSLISLRGSPSTYKWELSLQQHFDSASVLDLSADLSALSSPPPPHPPPSAHQKTPSALWQSLQLYTLLSPGLDSSLMPAPASPAIP